MPNSHIHIALTYTRVPCRRRQKLRVQLYSHLFNNLNKFKYYENKKVPTVKLGT